MSASDASQEGSRKRIKISKTASYPVNTAPPSATAHSQHGECHHEQSLRTLSADLESMRQLITCKMCYRFLYEPFGLSCGHTYCYGCLATWMANSKTCPDCRSKVKEQPRPTYLIREMVRVFTNRSELLPDGETKEEHDKHAQEEAEVVAKDKANEDVRKGGLFRGLFRQGSRHHPFLAIYDEQDRIYRCPICTVEVEDGQCIGCNVRVLCHNENSDYSDSDDDTGDELDGDLADIHDDDIDLGLGEHIDFGPYQDETDLDHSSDVVSAYGHFAAGDDDDDDDDDEDDEDDDLEGFVDDEVRYEDGVTHDEESEDGWETETNVPNTAGNANRRHHVRTDTVSNDEDESDDDAVLQHRVVPRFQRANQHPTVGASRQIDTESDEEDSEDDEPIRASSQRARLARTNGRQRRPITIESDEDENEEPSEVDHVDLSNHVAAMDSFSPYSVRTDESGAADYNDFGFEFSGRSNARTEEDGVDDGASVNFASDGDDDDEDRSEATSSVEDQAEGDNESERDEDEDESDDGQSSTHRTRADGMEAYTYRLSTHAPRSNRLADPLLIARSNSSNQQRWSNARLMANRPYANRISAETIRRGMNSHRAPQLSHPFQLSGTLDRINRNR